MSKILFSKNEDMSDAIAVTPPSFGYTVQLTKAVSVRRNIGNVSCFNHGIKNDFRDVEFTLQVDKNEVLLLRYFFDSLKMISVQNPEFYLKTSENFFAAGPDQGDNKIFEVSLANNPQFSAMMAEPFGFFTCKMKLTFANLEPIIPPSESPEFNASWDFGTVYGLRNPERNPEQEYAAARNNSLSGKPFVKNSFVDEFTTTITQQTTTAKMAELFYFLQAKRTTEFDINMGKNFWLFGPDVQENGKIEVKLLDNQFIITHIAPDLWSINLRLWHVKNKKYPTGMIIANPNIVKQGHPVQVHWSTERAETIKIYDEPNTFVTQMTQASGYVIRYPQVNTTYLLEVSNEFGKYLTNFNIQVIP